MKITKTLLTAISVVAAMTVTASAENGDKEGKRDGRPGKEARQKHRAAMKAKLLERFDSDKDGKLSPEERKTARETIAQERKAIHEAVLKEFDKNNDGKLDETERKGVKEWVKENYPDAIRMRPHRGGKHGKGKQKRKARGGKRGQQPAAAPGN